MVLSYEQRFAFARSASTGKYLPHRAGHRDASCWLSLFLVRVESPKRKMPVPDSGRLFSRGCFLQLRYHPIPLSWFPWLERITWWFWTIKLSPIINVGLMFIELLIINTTLLQPPTRLQNAEEPEGKTLRILMIHSPSPSCQPLLQRQI